MFDIGFWELVAIAMIALLVIGPERLPGFAQDAGRFIGKLRRYINTARTELRRELQLDKAEQLNDQIDHVDKLMKEAPDRFLRQTGSSNREDESTG